MYLNFDLHKPSQDCLGYKFDSVRSHKNYRSASNKCLELGVPEQEVWLVAQ